MTRKYVDLRWQEAAACRELERDLFFPSAEDDGVMAVAAICRSCPVRATCLAYALRHREPGLWAGTTSHQRRKLRRRRCESCGGAISVEELAAHEVQRALEWRCSSCGGVRVVRKAPDPRAALRAREAWLKHKRAWTPAYATSDSGR